MDGTSQSAATPPRLGAHLQGYGAVLVTDRDFERISHVSSNLDRFFGVAADMALGADPGAVIGETTAHSIRNILSHATIGEIAETFPLDRPDGAALMCSVSERGAFAVAEFFPKAEGAQTTSALVVLRHLAMLGAPGGRIRYIEDVLWRLLAITEADGATYWRLRPTLSAFAHVGDAALPVPADNPILTVFAENCAEWSDSLSVVFGGDASPVALLGDDPTPDISHCLLALPSGGEKFATGMILLPLSPRAGEAADAMITCHRKAGIISSPDVLHICELIARIAARDLPEHDATPTGGPVSNQTT